jgi:hypothetical protein
MTHRHLDASSSFLNAAKEISALIICGAPLPSKQIIVLLTQNLL